MASQPLRPGSIIAVEVHVTYLDNNLARQDTTLVHLRKPVNGDLRVDFNFSRGMKAVVDGEGHKTRFETDGTMAFTLEAKLTEKDENKS